jgi:hypothetical protein
MKNYVFKEWYVNHYLIEKSARPSSTPNLAQSKDYGKIFFTKFNFFKGEIKGGGRGCSDSSKGGRQMYGDFKLYFIGPFFLSLGQWYGWVAKNPEIGFTNNEIGINLFGRMITISKAFNFAKTNSGKRKFGIQIQIKKYSAYEGNTEVKDVEHPQIDRLIIDPHLKK